MVQNNILKIYLWQDKQAQIAICCYGLSFVVVVVTPGSQPLATAITLNVESKLVML